MKSEIIYYEDGVEKAFSTEIAAKAYIETLGNLLDIYFPFEYYYISETELIS